MYYMCLYSLLENIKAKCEDKFPLKGKGLVKKWYSNHWNMISKFKGIGNEMIMIYNMA